MSKLLSVVILAALATAPVIGFADDMSGQANQDKSSKGHTMDDAGITTKVKAALLDEKGLKSTGIHVKTVNGRVELTGHTDSQQNIDRAVEKAKTIEGVQSVDNKLVIKK